MSSYLQLFSRSCRPCLRSYRQPCLRRGIAQTHSIRSDTGPVPPSLEEVLEQEDEFERAEEAEAEAAEGKRSFQDSQDAESPKSYRAFIETIGNQYRTASPQNWLGKSSPFPMNPSFRPPAPISNATKNLIYQDYKNNRTPEILRALSQQYSISLKRVEAIIKLKDMEAAWYKKRETQSGFLRGMERLLGVRERITTVDSRKDAADADTLEQIEQRDATRQNYQRMYWESIPEHGGEPIVPAAIEHSQKLAERLTEKARLLKDKTYLPHIPDTDTIKTPKERVFVSEMEGRPSIHFVDVGTKFLDVGAESKRLARIEARAKHRAKKVEEKKKLLAQ